MWHGKVHAKSATWESHLHPREFEGMNPHTPKWTPTLVIGIPMEFQIFFKVFKGQKLIGSKSSLYIKKLLKLGCLKWIRMTHLST